MRTFLIYWLPVLAICAIIFAFSADSHSGIHSMRILRWLLGLVGADTYENLHRWHEPFRKLAHVIVYFSLGSVTYRAFAEGSGRFLWPAAARSLLFSAIYASSDEIHQIFVPTRGPSVRDVALDTASAALAIACYWMAKRHTAMRTNGESSGSSHERQRAATRR